MGVAVHSGGRWLGCMSTEEVFFLIVQQRETLFREFLLNREKKQGMHSNDIV